MREKFSLLRGRQMNAVLEARCALREIPRDPDEQKGAWLRKAGNFFGLTWSQTKKIEYGEVKDLRASTLLQMRERLTILRESAERQRGLKDELTVRINELRSNGRGRATERHRGIPQAEPRRGAGDAERGDSEG